MHYKRWRHYNNVSGKRCQKILTLCSANLAVSVSTAMSHTRTVLSSEKLATCLPSNRKSDRCVAFSWPSNVLKSVLLAMLKIRTLPSSLPTLKSWPSDRNFPPTAASRNFVKLLWTSFESGLKIWTWKSI